MEILSVKQAVSVWSHLDDAFYGTNSFGGDTAEIYGCQLTQFDPSRLLVGSSAMEAREDMARQAAQSLACLLKEFASIRDCEIEIDRHPFDGTVPLLDHRCHIRVIRKV